MAKIKIEKTVIILVSQLIKANKIIDEIQNLIDTNFTINVNSKLIKNIEDLKDCVNITY